MLLLQKLHLTSKLPQQSSVPGLTTEPRTIITGVRAVFTGGMLIMYLFFILLLDVKDILIAIKVMRNFLNKRKKLHGSCRIKKYVKSQGRYFFSENLPGWPSKAFTSYIRGEIRRATGRYLEKPALQTAIWAITCKCPLRCRHCCERVNLSDRETLTRSDLMVILEKLFQSGVRHLQLSGGEPLERFDDLLYLLEKARDRMDCWLLTSGYGMTFEKALSLKQAGLSGVSISLDHWHEVAHNDLRGNNQSYFWAKEAASHCRKTGIITGLSLCTTRSFVTNDNLQRYLRLAMEWHVEFIKLLEPRETEFFKGIETVLDAERITLLENFFRGNNFTAVNPNTPIITYPGYHQRRTGCFGAGNSYFYIDPKGIIHACPFCRGSAGNAASDRLDSALNQLKKAGCKAFQMNLTD